MRHEHAAGDKVFVDYAGTTMKIYSRNNESEFSVVQIFVGVLGASRYIYADAVLNQSIPNWIGSHVRMFEHFGGVPTVIVCDNLKSAVKKVNRHEPEINDTYQDMASHYGTMIIPARPYKPKDKAHAENGVLIVGRWILFRLRKRIFYSLDDLNKAIAELLTDLNNRDFQKRSSTRKLDFEKIDKPALKPLTTERYKTAEFLRMRVGHDYHIEIDGCHHYSVPNSLVLREVDVRLTIDTVEILHGGKRVASHARTLTAGKTSNPNHLPSTHQHMMNWKAEDELVWASSIGQNTYDFVQKIIEVQPRRELLMRSIGAIKSLAKNYGVDRVENSCRRALEIGAAKVRSLKSILESKLDQQAHASESLQETNVNHLNIRGADYYH